MEGSQASKAIKWFAVKWVCDCSFLRTTTSRFLLKQKLITFLKLRFLLIYWSVFTTNESNLWFSWIDWLTLIFTKKVLFQPIWQYFNPDLFLIENNSIRENLPFPVNMIKCYVLTINACSIADMIKSSKVRGSWKWQNFSYCVQ